MTSTSISAPDFSLAHTKIEEAVAIIDRVDNRCSATDGPVTPTEQAITRSEIAEVLKLIWAAYVELGKARLKVEAPKGKRKRAKAGEA